MKNNINNIIIKKATKKDLPRIFELLKQVNMHYIPSQEMPAISFENYFTAKINDTVVGFCGYKILTSTEAKTELMVVDAKYRGKGIGYKLQVRRMDDMFQKGIMILTTNTDLPDTIAWYKNKFGYKKIGKLKKIHEFGEPGISYWTTLQVDLLKWDAKRRKIGKS